MGGGGEPGHVQADLGDDDVGGDRVDAGDLAEPGDRVGVGGDLGADPGVDGGDVGVDGVDAAEHLGEQECVVVGEVAGERLLQFGEFGAQTAAGVLGQYLGVALAGDQRGEHVPSGGAEDVGGHRGDLDLGVLQELLHALLLAGACGHQVGAVAGQVPQCADLARRDEAGADHLPLRDLGRPDRVELVGLGPARQVLDVPGVDQPYLEAGRLQEVERGPPVVGRGLHDHPGHPRQRRWSHMPSRERVMVG